MPINHLDLPFSNNRTSAEGQCRCSHFNGSTHLRRWFY